MPLTVTKYIKPGIDLTKEIMDNLNPKTQVFILKNHGLICCGNSVKEVSDLIRKVELRLKMPIIRKIDQLFESENIPNYKLCHILLRLPLDWVPEPIGEKAEAELLDWDAEKYRKSLSNE